MDYSKGNNMRRPYRSASSAKEVAKIGGATMAGNNEVYKILVLGYRSHDPLVFSD